MAPARLLALVLLVVAMPALAADPHPPQLAVSFLAEPAPIVQDGSTRLVYEMQIVNYTKSAYVLDAVEAKAGETAATFRGPALEGMIRRFGLQGDPAGAANRTIEPGRGAIVFLMLDLGKAQAPPTIAHTLSVLDDKGEAHEMPLAPLAVSSERPIVVGAPLRGQWIAGDSVSNAPGAAHRRAVLILNGRPYISQRFAIDWVQVQTIGGVTTTWKGPEDKNESYFCYDRPIYSVADGKVVAMSDGARRTRRTRDVTPSRSTLITRRGNHVVVEIAPTGMCSTRTCAPGPWRPRSETPSAPARSWVMSATPEARPSPISTCISTTSLRSWPETACLTNSLPGRKAGRSRRT